MTKLHPTQQFVPAPESVSYLLTHYGLPPLSYRSAESGIENLTLLLGSDDQKFVLRVYRQGKKSDADILRELDFMAALRRSGLPLPTLRKTQQGETLLKLHIGGQQWQCLLMDYAPGRHPSTYTPALVESMAMLQAHMHLVGERYATVEGLAVSCSVLHDAEFAQALLENHDLSAYGKARQVGAFLERARTFEVELGEALPWGMSHFDYDADNLLADENDRVTAILDFDDAQCLPFAVCLGYTLWDIFASGADELDADAPDLIVHYLRAYQVVRPLSATELMLLPRVMLLRHYLVTTCDMVLGEMKHDVWEVALQQEAQLQKLRLMPL